ncbi:MAG TPA: hypothetical protein VG248_05135 [Caulobacteraceae bacterium]|jgi:hypothetical protein|nr:hypothetical protein [Caulobacteraceae bacterium]
MRLKGLLFATFLAVAAPVGAMAQTQGAPPAAPAAAVHAGEVAFANSGAEAAQAPFLEGLALLHDFEYERAALAFQRAEAADPGFAMAYWGEAMTHNHTVWMQQDLGAARAVLAKLGATPQARAAKAPTARERAYLAAIEILYGEGAKDARDFRYADAMALVHAQYPDDVDATAFYALALLGTCHQGRDFATYMKAAALLEAVYPTHLRHPGVLHYMIHSYDDPIHAPLGLRPARRYGALAPDAPHALHMTSHIFLALGMWDEVIKANTAALAAGDSIRAGARSPGSRCGHYFTWLAYADLQERRDSDASALLGACRITAEAQLTGPSHPGFDPDRSGVASYVFMRLMQAVETGRWDPEERLALPDAGFEAPRFFDAYGDAVAAYRARDPAAMKVALARLQAAATPLLAQMSAQGDTRTADLESVKVIVGQMDAAGRILAGDQAGGLAALRAVATGEGAIPMEFGPPSVALPTFELLGEELLRAQRPADAADAFRSALARAPGRTRSLEGLLTSEQRSGDQTAAAATQAELARYRRAPV